MTYNTASHGKPHFNTDKKRPYCDIMATARAMLAHPQPIKCLESVMLAIHLTNQRKFHDLDRVPIGFKTVDTVTHHDYRYSAKLPCFSYASFLGSHWDAIPKRGNISVCLQAHRSGDKREGDWKMGRAGSQPRYRTDVEATGIPVLKRTSDRLPRCLQPHFTPGVESSDWATGTTE